MSRQEKDPDASGVSPGAPGRAFAFAGDLLVLLAEGKHTGGSYALVEIVASPGSGPPLHLHRREQEAFYVLEGEVTIWLRDMTFTARPGAFVHVPVGTFHTYRNDAPTPARLLVLLVPAGLERFFDEVGEPLPDRSVPVPPPTAADIQKMLAAAPRHGIEFAPPE